MNFKFTKGKTIFSLIAGFLLGWFIYFLRSQCVSDTLIASSCSFRAILFFGFIFISIILIYIIYSLFQAK
ncbi:hypothetical protein COU54_02685 [Candidatus Pacearchaeota archaeon CG10_big_fil_rev_8_21_14_0_10_31_24]|nr:MAG: hypothetical protein COU54_02685 [Candidatus Pacearchaeota archaeon CG10_big_fil_rev_8_21_14_0_10_31_24]